jgi:hypothetical protein
VHTRDGLLLQIARFYEVCENAGAGTPERVWSPVGTSLRNVSAQVFNELSVIIRMKGFYTAGGIHLLLFSDNPTEWVFAANRRGE